jgi:hypothetical protein
MERLLPFLLIFVLACGPGEEKSDTSSQEGKKDSARAEKEPSEAKERLGIDTLVSIASSVEKRSLENPEVRKIEDAGNAESSPILRSGKEGALRLYRFPPYRAVEFRDTDAAKKAFEDLEAHYEEDGGRTLDPDRGSYAYALVEHYVLHCSFSCEPTPKEDAKYRSWRKWIASLGEPSGHFLVACKS